MESRCKRPLDEIQGEAMEELAKITGLPKASDVRHVRFWKQYPNSGGPFRGGVVCNAFWRFEMDCFVLSVEDQDTQERFDIAAVFAAGRFWAVVKWEMEVSMTELPESKAV